MPPTKPDDNWESRGVFVVSYWFDKAPSQSLVSGAFVAVASRYVSASTAGNISPLAESLWPALMENEARGGWEVRKYSVELPKPLVSDLPTDLSGTAARTLSGRNSLISEGEMALERSLADTVLWELTNFLSKGDYASGSGYPIVILRGPLSPALRGRLLYRSISEEIPLIAISSEPQDVEGLVARLPILETDRQASLRWYGPFPPIAVDEGSRYFVATRSGKPLFVAEMPCATAEPLLTPEHWDSRLRLCEWLFDDNHVANIKSMSHRPLAGLPFALARASDAARATCHSIRDEELRLATAAEAYCSMPGHPKGAVWDKFLTKLNTKPSADLEELAGAGRYSPEKKDPLSVYIGFRTRYYERCGDPDLRRLLGELTPAEKEPRPKKSNKQR